MTPYQDFKLIFAHENLDNPEIMATQEVFSDACAVAYAKSVLFEYTTYLNDQSDMFSMPLTNFLIRFDQANP